jgi:hypothetical protein
LDKFHFKEKGSTEPKIAHLRTEHYTFVVKVKNNEDHTYFGCSNWRAFCKAYGLDEDMNITFDLGNDDVRDNNIDIWVHAEDDLIPVLPPGAFVNRFVRYFILIIEKYLVLIPTKFLYF